MQDEDGQREKENTSMSLSVCVCVRTCRSILAEEFESDSAYEYESEPAAVKSWIKCCEIVHFKTKQVDECQLQRQRLVDTLQREGRGEKMLRVW